MPFCYFPSAFVAGNNILWHGMPLWSVGCAPSQLHVHTLSPCCWGEVRDKKNTDPVQAVLRDSKNILVLSNCFQHRCKTLSHRINKEENYPSQSQPILHCLFPKKKNLSFFCFVSRLLIMFSWSMLSHMLFRWRTANCS